jgi:uncharacterized protein
MFLTRDKTSLYKKTQKLLVAKRGYKRPFAYMIWRLKRLPGTPEFIARGLAIGIAINFWPILFTHLVFGYLLCRLMRGSILAMAVGTLAGNPWTFAVVYPIMYKIGKILLGLNPIHSERSLDSAEEVASRLWPIESWPGFVHALQEIFFPMMLGGFLLGLPVTILTFYATRNAVRVYQTQRRKHLLRKFEDVEHDIEESVS